MKLNCPVCKAENTTSPTCRRCRADLSLLVSLEVRREHYLASACQAIRDGRLDDGLGELTKVDDLRVGPDSRRMRACAYLLAGDFPSAAAEHGAATRP